MEFSDMRRRTKGLLAILVIVAITVPTVLYILNGIINPPPPEPLNLDEAPAEIRALKADLKEKLSEGTFTWDDMNNFTIFAEYVAAHHPEALGITKDWEITAVLEIIDTGYLWFVVENDALNLTAKSVPPADPDVTIILRFDTLVEVFSAQTTAATAFQRGDVDFDGTLAIALKIDRLNTIFSYTIMDAKLYYSSGIIDFVLTENIEGSYTPGYTLFPCIESIITNESMETGAMGAGKVLIVDDQGTVVNQLDDSQHSVHKFINSTAVMMGGSDGLMEIWDFVSDTRVELDVPAGHHELDYNPITDTFMVLETATQGEIWNGLEVIYDTISEYNWDGDLLWQWDARVHLPFNSTIYTAICNNYTFRGYTDWMHANSFAWDKVENTIWLNVRNQDTILKIDKDTGDIIWRAGRNGNFTILALNGTEVDSIWHYPHSLEWIGDNHYILFDNGLFDPNVPSSMTRDGTGISGFVEFEIDEENQEIREVWSWHSTNSSYYFSESGGDADRLPNGNTLGIFANKALVLARPDPIIFAEVTPDGEIAWELQVRGGNGTYYWAHRVERFYETPLVEIQDQVLDINAGALYLNLSTWNCVKEMFSTDGEIRVIVDGIQIYQDTFEFQPQWIPTNLEISLSDLPASIRYIELQIENSDGILKSVVIYGSIESQSVDPVFYILAGIAVAIPVIVVITLIRTGRIKFDRE
jgi:hypothetical protein